MLRKLVIVALLLSAYAYADGGCTHDVAMRTQSGSLQAIAGARAKVYEYTVSISALTPLATIYTDATLGISAPNPAIADTKGNFHFCAVPGQYTVVVTNPNDNQSYTLQQVTVPLALDGVLSVKAINAIRYADHYTGSDCGAKINAADAELGSGGGEIWVNKACGTTWSTAVSLRNPMRFVECGTYTTSAAITLSVANAAISGAPSGQTTGCATLKQANSANLPALIVMSAAQTVLQDITVDGNKDNNASGGTNIKVTAHRAELYRVTTKNAKTHGLSFISTGTSNEAGSGKVFRLMANENGQSGIYGSGSADVFVGGGSELESNGTYGIELSDSPTWRIEHSDIGGNASGGIYVYGTAAGIQSNRQVIVGNQFGNNLGHDIRIVGYNAGDTSVGSNITGNSFIGLDSTVATNTYDAIKIVDGGANSISGNAIENKLSHAYKYGIEITETSAGRSYQNIIGINSFGIVGAGTAKFSDTTTKAAAALVENLWSSAGNVEGAFGLRDTTSGAATPKKYFRVSGGNLQIINDAFGAVIVSVTDTGKGTFNGGLDTGTLATGTAPIITSSTTVNTNFNADMVDGLHAASFADATATTSALATKPAIVGTPTVNRASCWKTATTLGYCSTVVDASGACTCN